MSKCRAARAVPDAGKTFQHYLYLGVDLYLPSSAPFLRLAESSTFILNAVVGSSHTSSLHTVISSLILSNFMPPFYPFLLSLLPPFLCSFVLLLLFSLYHPIRSSLLSFPHVTTLISSILCLSTTLSSFLILLSL